MKPFKVVRKTKNINSKKLVAEIHQAITSVVDEYVIVSRGILDSTYDYTQLAEYIEVYMEEMLKEKTVLQYDVICDDRNNDPLIVRRGHINLTVKFVQWNCLNTTQIDYVLTK